MSILPQNPTNTAPVTQDSTPCVLIESQNVEAIFKALEHRQRRLERAAAMTREFLADLDGDIIFAV